MIPVTILFLTYARTDYAVATVKAAKRFLAYDGGLHWFIVDDGSHQAHIDAVTRHLPNYQVYTHRAGYGANVNVTWPMTQQTGPITLWLEDDFELTKPLDITPYVKLLMGREDVGAVRLGYLPVGLDLHSVGYDGRMYLKVEKSQQYCFSGNPHLKHERFMEYGPYPESLNPGETEIAYDHQVRSKDGPAIWWPLAIGDAPYFGHIGQVKSYES